MPSDATIQSVLHLARQLSPLEKLRVIEQLAPDLEAALRSEPDDARLDDVYQQGYERIPEDNSDTVALLPHLAIPEEQWE